MGWDWFLGVAPTPVAHLFLIVPQINDSYEAFANGIRFGSYGKMPPHAEVYYGNNSPLFVIPLFPTGLPSESRKITIAVRVWHAPWIAPSVGGGPIQASGLVGESGGPGLVGESREVQRRLDLNLAADYWDAT